MAFIRASQGGGGGISNIDLTNPDYVSNEVTIAVNASYTFTTEKRIKQCLFMCMVLSGSYPPLFRLYNCEEEKAIYVAGNPSNSISEESFNASCLSQTDTTITLKNVSSVSRKYKLLAWF